jgi:FkbM family methyltransferase
MEGDACYKFSTIERFVRSSGAPPVRLMLDIGANVGSVARLMKFHFPDAVVHAYEPVPELCEIARRRTCRLSGVHVHGVAVSVDHLYADDFGELPRDSREDPILMRARPCAGVGWLGGSVVIHSSRALSFSETDYARDSSPVAVLTLDEAVERVLADEGANHVDVLKFDCEGCEHGCLGAAAKGTLRRVRFIVGEYHGLERFYRVVSARLFPAFRVSLIGDRALGAFFAENVAFGPPHLLHEDPVEFRVRSWLSALPMTWHAFDLRYVSHDQRLFHGLA